MRTNQTYCSDACRQYAWRQRRKAQEENAEYNFETTEFGSIEWKRKERDLWEAYVRSLRLIGRAKNKDARLG
jgi:hypothetical protein